jgi:hypothetical protein
MGRQELEHPTIPWIGDRVERRIAGISKIGTVHYADQLQALIKWDDGSSSSLRLDRDRVRVVESSARGMRQREVDARPVVPA